MKTLGDIEEEYDQAVEEETNDLKDSFKKIKNLKEKKELEKDYDKNLKKIVEKYEKAVKKYSQAHGNLLLKGEIKPKKEEDKKMEVYHSKHINLTRNRKDILKIKKAFFLFKFKLELKKILRLMVPSFLGYFIFKMKLFLMNIYSDFYRRLNWLFNRFIKLSIKFFKKVWVSLKPLIFFFPNLIKKILPKKEETKKEDLLEENKKRIKEKS